MYLGGTYFNQVCTVACGETAVATFSILLDTTFHGVSEVIAIASGTGNDSCLPTQSFLVYLFSS